MQGSGTVSPEAGVAPQTLLVVDDDEGLRENLQELFESLGYRVLTASSTADALEQLDRSSVDLVLTDYKMPGATGVELLETLRHRCPQTRGILMTAFGDSFMEIESVRRGAVGYLTKPFEVDDVVDVVQRILRLRTG